MLESKASVKTTFTVMFVVICMSCLAGGECTALLQKLQQEQSHYLCLGQRQVCEFIPQNALYEEETKHRGQTLAINI